MTFGDGVWEFLQLQEWASLGGNTVYVYSDSDYIVKQLIYVSTSDLVDGVWCTESMFDVTFFLYPDIVYNKLSSASFYELSLFFVAFASNTRDISARLLPLLAPVLFKSATP